MKNFEQMTLPDGRMLSYAEYGATGGTPVFYCHGWPSCRYHAAHFHDPAKQMGLRIIAADRPGVGHSDPLPGRHFPDWSTDILALAEHLKLDRFRLLANSGGCPYALSGSIQLAARIEKTAILCGAPPLSTAEAQAHMHWIYRSLSKSQTFRKLAVKLIVPSARWMVQRRPEQAPLSWFLKSLPASDREALLVGSDWDQICHGFLEATRQGANAVLQEGELYLHDWGFDPADIQVPVAFWHGKADSNLPIERVAELAALIPNAETNWIEGEGHYSIVLHHAKDVLKWLVS